MRTTLGVGANSGVVNYNDTEVKLKWIGSTPAKGEEGLKSFTEIICAETAVKNRYKYCTIRQLLA
jgi:hypothetical protein